MKESEELYNIISSTNCSQELRDLKNQINEFDQYVATMGIDIQKKQLIMSPEEKFRCKSPQELM